MPTLRARSYQRDEGFTLIELLVVMIIIGILAAVAIPIFLNQQKTARDSQTVSDAKNMVANIQSSLVTYPNANCYAFLDTPTSTPACPHGTTATDVSSVQDVTSGKVLLFVGSTPTKGVITEVTVSKGTSFVLWGNSCCGVENSYALKTWNDDGKSYLETSPYRYDSQGGHFK